MDTGSYDKSETLYVFNWAMDINERAEANEENGRCHRVTIALKDRITRMLEIPLGNSQTWLGETNILPKFPGFVLIVMAKGNQKREAAQIPLCCYFKTFSWKLLIGYLFANSNSTGLKLNLFFLWNLLLPFSLPLEWHLCSPSPSSQKLKSHPGLLQILHIISMANLNKEVDWGKIELPDIEFIR